MFHFSLPVLKQTAAALLLALALVPAAQAQAPAAASTPVPFTYTPPAPVKGRLLGVAVLGATGFDMFVVRADKHHAWQLVKSEYNRSYLIEGMATESDIRSRLDNYLKEMQAAGVRPQDTHLLVSSGAAQSPGTVQVAKALQAKGYHLTQVTPAQEARYAALATLPAAYDGRGFVVDIGSGNTKLAWHSAGHIETAVTYGSKAYLSKLLKTPTVVADVKTKAQEIPTADRSICLLLGGVAHELAALTRHGDERYTTLILPAASYGPGITAQQKAGLLIYEDIAEATGCQQFVFDWHSNFAIGYLLEKN